MKELYISPVLNVLCFAPVERLANISFSDLLDASNNTSGGAQVKDPSSTDNEGDWVFPT